MIYVRILSDFLFFFYTLFLVSSTFSIAVAQISLGVSLFLYLFIIFLKRENPFGGELKYFYLAIGGYVFWMIVSSLFSRTPVDSLLILKEEWLFAAIPMGIFLLQKESFRKKMIFSFISAIGIIAVYAVLQHFFGFHWFKTELYKAYDYGYTVKGFFPHRLTFGNYYATVSMFMLGYVVPNWNQFTKGKRITFLTVLVLAIIATFYTYSYGPILAVILSLILLGIITLRKYSIILLLLVGLTSTIVYFSSDNLKSRIDTRIAKELRETSESSRYYIWSNAYKMISSHPLTGVGQGNFYHEFEKQQPGRRLHVHGHNDIINIAAIGGIPAAAAFTAIWVLFFLYVFRKYKKEESNKDTTLFLASLLGGFAFFVSSLTEATFADEEVRQMLMAVWAIGLFSYNGRKK